MVKNTTTGSHELNFKIVKPWMTGWHCRCICLSLGRFLLQHFQLIAFPHWVSMHLDFTYSSTNIVYFLFIPFFMITTLALFGIIPTLFALAFAQVHLLFYKLPPDLSHMLSCTQISTSSLIQNYNMVYLGWFHVKLVLPFPY